MLKGSCLCGDIQIEIQDSVKWLMHCHCSMCRKFHGSAFATFGVVDAESLTWLNGADRVSRYQSSEYGSRSFCRRCASPVPSPNQKEGINYVPAGIFTGDLGEDSSLHLFVASKAPWHHIADDHEQHAEWPPGWDNNIQIESEKQESTDTESVAGSCLCGKVRFKYEGEADRMVNCHCSRCRRQKGAAFGTFVFIPKGQFHWLRGEEEVVNYKMPEARLKGTAFCRHCGSLVPRLRDETHIQIPAGSLDDDPGITPGVNIFTESKATWSTVDESIACFPEYPT